MQGFRTSFFIAYKSVTRGNRSMLVLIIFILSLSFLNMLFISGVLSGLSNSFIAAIIDYSSADLTINPQDTPRVKEYIPNQAVFRKQLETIPGVTATAREYLMAGSLAYDRDKNGQYKTVSGSIVGVDPTELSKTLKIANDVEAGTFLSPGDTDQIVLSSALAGGYGDFAPTDLGGAKVGDKVRITYDNGIIRTYTVKGIYRDPLQLYETFITSKEAESVLGTYDNASAILVKTDLAKAPLAAYQSQVEAMAPHLVVKNYEQLFGSFSTFLSALGLISFIVSAISVIVAAVTIFVLVYVTVVNRRRQIGILKAIGIHRGIIVNAYVLQSFFYVFCGLAIGSLLSFGVISPLLIAHPVPVVEGFMNLTFAYSALSVAVSVACFAVAGYLAGVIPARLVANEPILEAIWR